MASSSVRVTRTVTGPPSAEITAAPASLRGP
jgi:hypothetical protein